MRLTALLIAGFLFVQAAHADTIMLEDFETSGSARSGVVYTPSHADSLGDISNLDYYGVVNLGAPSLPASMMYSNLQGTDFYGLQDTDGALTPAADISLTWTGINITDYINLDLSWFIAEESNSTGGGEHWDSTSSFRVEVQTDGGGFNRLFRVEAEEVGGDQINNAPRIDTNDDGVGDSTEITDTFTQFNTSLTNGSTMDIRIVFEGLNAGGEDIAFDHLHLQGDFIGVPEPGSLAVLLGFVAVASYRRRLRNGVAK